jgi:O-antigen ligase
MRNEIDAKPWFGHGANAQEWFLEELFGTLTQPHNDWLRLEFDYGYIGTGLFGATLLAQALLAWTLGMKSSGPRKMLFLSGASAFVSFVLIMVTDNIILYAVYFGNLHFAIMGLAYAASRDELRGREHAERLDYAPRRFFAAGAQRRGMAKGRPRG